MQVLVTATAPGTARTPSQAPWPEDQMATLRAAFPDIQFCDGVTHGALDTIAGADIVFGHLHREEFLAARNLRWIQSHGAGVDWAFAIPELVAGDVILSSTKGAQAITIAEHTFGLLIALARQFYTLFRAQEQRHFLRPVLPSPVGITGMTMGIVGFGAIGRAIAQRAQAFDMQVVAVDAREVPLPDYVAKFWPVKDLPELLRCADVVVITAPLTPETRNLIGAEQLALMKPTAYLIGVSRGGVIDEHALVQALTAGRIAGAALDVHQQFIVPPDSELWQAPNLIHTPHCSGLSQLTTDTTTAIFKENLAHYLAGEPLVNLVDKTLGY